MTTISVIAYGVAVLIAAYAQVLLKISANKEKEKPFKSKFFNKYTMFAYFLLFASLCINTLALKQLELRYVPCIAATSFVWVLLFSYVFLSERPSFRKIIGTVIILCGIVISVF